MPSNRPATIRHISPINGGSPINTAVTVVAAQQQPAQQGGLCRPVDEPMITAFMNQQLTGADPHDDNARELVAGLLEGLSR